MWHLVFLVTGCELQWHCVTSTWFYIASTHGNCQKSCCSLLALPGRKKRKKAFHLAILAHNLNSKFPRWTKCNRISPRPFFLCLSAAGKQRPTAKTILYKRLEATSEALKHDSGVFTVFPSWFPERGRPHSEYIPQAIWGAHCEAQKKEKKKKKPDFDDLTFLALCWRKTSYYLCRWKASSRFAG